MNALNSVFLQVKAMLLLHNEHLAELEKFRGNFSQRVSNPAKRLENGEGSLTTPQVESLQETPNSQMYHKSSGKPKEMKTPLLRIEEVSPSEGRTLNELRTATEVGQNMISSVASPTSEENLQKQSPGVFQKTPRNSIKAIGENSLRPGERVPLAVEKSFVSPAAAPKGQL